MRQPVPRGKRKPAEKPVIITTNTQFKPRISERTIKKRKEARENRYKPSKFASGMNLCGIILLYIFLVLCVLIGAGGIAVCAIYFNANSSTQGWKIAGIAMGAVTCIIGIILISLTIFKQTRNRPWKYKKKELLVTEDVDFIGDEDDDDDDKDGDDDGKSSSDDSDDDDEEPDEKNRDSVQGKSNPAYLAGAGNSLATDRKREMASSPFSAPIFQPLHHQSLNNDMMFCPGCNRMHPTSHQCMYSTRVANGFATNVRTAGPPPAQGSIAVQTEDDGKKKKKKSEPHTLIDRTLKYSNTTETQTDVTAKPGSNVTESIILRRVPIPTAKVIVQQPTTKVMIVKVPNTAGQLVLQQRPMPGSDH